MRGRPDLPQAGNRFLIICHKSRISSPGLRADREQREMQANVPTGREARGHSGHLHVRGIRQRRKGLVSGEKKETLSKVAEKFNKTGTIRKSHT